jgi:N-acetylmuramoyl-L-alanine amidase
MRDRARGRNRQLTFSMERRRALRWLAIPAAAFAIPPAFAAPTVASTRVWPAQEYTRVILEGPEPIAHQLVSLRMPDRLVLDLEGVELTTQIAKLATQLDANDPYITGVRFGRPVFSVLRVVFDLRTGVNPQVFQLPPVAEFGHRLVLDVYPLNPVDPLMALLERCRPSRRCRARPGRVARSRSRRGGSSWPSIPATAARIPARSDRGERTKSTSPSRSRAS